MSSSINATTTNGILLNSDNSGILQLQSGGTTIATISSTGLQQNVGAPAFSASGSFQTISQSTNTKFQFNTKQFDTNSNYDATTNYRFTPTVAGYYLVTLNLAYIGTLTASYLNINIYKNGSQYIQISSANSVAYPQPTGTLLMYLNGSTDYIEAYGYTNQASPSSISLLQFSAAMVRSA